MGHLQFIEKELRQFRQTLHSPIEDADFEALLRFFKAEVLASYRNGLAAKDSKPAAPRTVSRPRRGR